MEDAKEKSTTPAKKSTWYFGIGWVFLFLMAFTWSLDASFLFIFLGIAVFFFFLGYWNKPYMSTANQPSSSGGFFRKKNPSASYYQSTTATTTPQAQQGKRFALGIAFFIGMIFFFSIVTVLCSDDEGSYTVENYAVDYYQVAEDYYRNEEYDSARVNYRRAIKLNPGNAAALVGYGNTLYALKTPDSTMSYYNRAIAADADYEYARYCKGWLYYDRKDYAQATIEIKALLQKSPDYEDASLLLGDIYYNQEMYQDALTLYEGVYAKGTRTNPLSKTMADIYALQGKNQKAITLYKEAISMDSTDSYSIEKLRSLGN